MRTQRPTRPEAESQKPEAPSRSAYVAALTMLARRELSERQIRDRLARKGYQNEDLDAAVERLKAERAIDDARAAGAMARTEIGIKRRGRLRVRRQIENAGIAPAVARAAVDAAFGEIDGDALLAAALSRRLRGDRPIADDREYQRLYRYLIAQGFEADAVLRELRRRRAPAGSDGDDLE